MLEKIFLSVLQDKFKHEKFKFYKKHQNQFNKKQNLKISNKIKHCKKNKKNKKSYQ